MAKQKGITFEDIIAGQQKWASRGDAKAAEQVAYFQAMAKNAEEQLAVSKQSRMLMAADTIESEQMRREEKGMHEDVKKGLVDTSGDGLNSNVIKLTREIKKTLGALVPIKGPQGAGDFSPENRGKLSEDLMAQGDKYVKGPRDLIPNLKEKFSLSNIMRSLEGEGTGLLGTFLKKRRIKNQYIEDQQSMGNTKSREEISQQFEKVNQLRKTMGTDVAERERLRKEGYSEEQIDRTGVNARIMRTQTLMRETDPLLAERNPVSVVEGAGGSLADGLTGAESEVAAETTRLMGDQAETLQKIEENTRGLAEAIKGSLKPSEGGEKEEGSGLGIGDLLGVGKGLLKRGAGALGKGARAIPGLISRGAGALGKGAQAIPGLISRGAGATKNFLGGAGGKALMIAGAGTAAYQGVSDLTEGKKVETAGEIVPEGWNKANPFAWAMRGGMYAGEKINQGYGKVSSMLGGSGTLGGDIYEGVQKVKGANLGRAALNAVPGVGLLNQAVGYGGKLVDKAKDVYAADLTSATQADQQVGATNKLITRDVNGVKSREIAQGTTAKKSVLGSTLLGSLFSREGATTQQFSGQTQKDSGFSNIFGQRKAKGLFERDEYSENAGAAKGVEVDKSTYYDLEKMVQAGQTEKALARVEVIARAQKETVDKSRMIAPPPKGADVLYNKSSEMTGAASAPKPAPTIVNAPTTINKTTQVHNAPPKARNQESSVSEFLKNRYR